MNRAIEAIRAGKRKRIARRRRVDEMQKCLFFGNATFHNSLDLVLLSLRENKMCRNNTLRMC